MSKLQCDCGRPDGQHRSLGCGVPYPNPREKLRRCNRSVDEDGEHADVRIDPKAFAALMSALIEIRDEASGFSQRQSEGRGFTDACLRMNRIAEMAHRALKGRRR